MSGRIGMMVQLLTDLIFDDNGGVTGKGHDDEDIDATVGWHFGFYSRPLDGARGAVLKADGKGNTSFLICFRDKQYELSLQKGECGFKNAFDAYLLLNQQGVLELNGSVQKAVRGDDLQAWLTSHTHGTPVGPSSTPVQPFTPTILSSKVKLS
jgi:phage gp45-like